MNRFHGINEEQMIALREVQTEINDWQLQQFPKATLSGVSIHLMKERAEAAEELADCFFLSSQCERLGGVPMGIPEFCWQAIHGLGYVPQDIIRGKLAKNKNRNWPETPDAHGVYEAQDDNENQAQDEG